MTSIASSFRANSTTTTTTGRSNATGGSNAIAENWVPRLESVGVHDATHDQMVAGAIRPAWRAWSTTQLPIAGGAGGPHTRASGMIFGLEEGLFDQVDVEWRANADNRPLLDAAHGFSSVSSAARSAGSAAGADPASLIVLSTFRYAVARLRRLHMIRVEEADWQAAMSEVVVNLLGGEALDVSSTNTPVAATLQNKFGKLIAVKPNISVGLRRSVIDFRQHQGQDQGDDAAFGSMTYTGIEMYVQHQRLLFNLNKLLSKPWYPFLICELKSAQGVYTDVETQLTIGMYYALNLAQELARRARAADPKTYAQSHAGAAEEREAEAEEVDKVMGRVYGLRALGAQWEVWMMASRTTQPHFVSARGRETGQIADAKPMMLLGQGSSQDLSGMKLLFSLLDHIGAEAEVRRRTVGRWLYCLRNRTHEGDQEGDAGGKRGRADGEGAEDVTPRKASRTGRGGGFTGSWGGRIEGGGGGEAGHGAPEVDMARVRRRRCQGAKGGESKVAVTAKVEEWLSSVEDSNNSGSGGSDSWDRSAVTTPHCLCPRPVTQ